MLCKVLARTALPGRVPSDARLDIPDEFVRRAGLLEGPITLTDGGRCWETNLTQDWKIWRYWWALADALELQVGHTVHLTALSTSCLLITRLADVDGPAAPQAEGVAAAQHVAKRRRQTQVSGEAHLSLDVDTAAASAILMARERSGPTESPVIRAQGLHANGDCSRGSSVKRRELSPMRKVRGSASLNSVGVSNSCSFQHHWSVLLTEN